jgi:hypothetical protein
MCDEPLIVGRYGPDAGASSEQLQELRRAKDFLRLVREKRRRDGDCAMVGEPWLRKDGEIRVQAGSAKGPVTWAWDSTTGRWTNELGLTLLY